MTPRIIKIITKTILFTTASARIKTLRIKLTEEVQNLREFKFGQEIPELDWISCKHL